MAGVIRFGTLYVDDDVPDELAAEMLRIYGGRGEFLLDLKRLAPGELPPERPERPERPETDE